MMVDYYHRSAQQLSDRWRSLNRKKQLNDLTFDERLAALREVARADKGKGPGTTTAPITWNTAGADLDK
jgi:hypothetical protein